MPESVAPAATPSSPPTSDLNASVSTSVDRLILGRTLQHPLYDAQGLLLLAGGAVITPEFKRQLQARKLNQVQVHRDDAQMASLQVDHTLSDAGLSKLDSAIVAKLDSTIESGLLFVHNQGPAAKDDFVFHGRKAFDQHQRQQLLDLHESTSSSIDGMVRDALTGKSVSAESITQMAASYLTDMSSDAQHVLATVSEVNRTGLAQHCLQMSILGMAIGVEMGFDAENVRIIGVAGLLHDWGMTRIPAEIREARRVLTAVEFIEIQKHPIYTLNMLERMTGVPRLVPLIAYQVHERVDGSGYPRGRTRNFIHQFARILQVADIFSALTAQRPYAPRMMPYAAMECLLQLSRRKLVDSDVVRALLNIQSLFPIGSYVALSDGQIARVLRPNSGQFSKPIVQLVQNATGKPYSLEDPDSVLDLKTENAPSVVQALPTPGQDEVSFATEYVQLRREL